ncbi:MAG: hypothetical protein DME97_10335 [Verrucomicrobia bacterium]|nr:MAG: hypothetical protein DME97_10335 [Verrucomicrobiota bacterium]
MRRLIDWIAIRWSAFLDRLLIRRPPGVKFFGPLLIDRGRGLLYDVERDLTCSRIPITPKRAAIRPTDK